MLWLAQPTLASLASGRGDGARRRGDPHLGGGTSREEPEVTRSGPYRCTRHPLYLGSSIIGAGIALRVEQRAGRRRSSGIYVGTFIPAAIRGEEAHLREKFGGDYDAYVAQSAPPMRRAFSCRARAGNREHHTIAGSLIGFALLALKVRLSHTDECVCRRSGRRSRQVSGRRGDADRRGSGRAL